MEATARVARADARGALHDLEEHAIGSSITKVEINRTFGRTAKDFWVMGTVHLRSGATLEIYHSDDPAKHDGAKPAVNVPPILAKMVRSGRPEGDQRMWIANDAFAYSTSATTSRSSCTLWGWDSSGRAASIELRVDGKVLLRKAVESQPIHASCDLQVGTAAKGLEVQVFDDAGTTLWKGLPTLNEAGGFSNSYRDLDMPSTRGSTAPR